MVVLTKVTAPLDLLAKDFVPRGVDLLRSNESRTVCLADASDVLQKALRINVVYRPESSYETELARFQSHQGDIATHISYGLKEKDIKEIYAVAKAQKVDSLKLAPEDIMRQVIVRALPYERLERIVKGPLSRKDLKKKLAKDYELDRGEKITTSVLEGKHAGIVYALIIASFKTELAKDWQRFYTQNGTH